MLNSNSPSLFFYRLLRIRGFNNIEKKFSFNWTSPEPYHSYTLIDAEWNFCLDNTSTTDSSILSDKNVSLLWTVFFGEFPTRQSILS